VAVTQRFNDLFAELQQDVTRLEKQQTELTQSCATLEARESFVRAKLAEQQQALDTAKLNHDTNRDTAEQAIQVVREQLAVTQKEVDELTRKRTAIVGELSTLKAQQEADIQAATTALTTLTADIAEQQEVKDELDTAVLRLKEEIRASTEAAKVLDAEASKQASAVSQALQELEQQELTIDAHRQVVDQQIATIDAELTSKQAEQQQALYEAAEAKKQHGIFIDFQERAKKALQAKELSLQEREDQLERAELRARRQGILDNV
jgi:chromosome segregation ATPase